MHAVQAIAVTHHGQMYFVKVSSPEISNMHNFYKSYMAFAGKQSMLPYHRFGHAFLPDQKEMALHPKIIVVINTYKGDVVDCTDNDKIKLHMYLSEFEQRFSAPYCMDKT